MQCLFCLRWHCEGWVRWWTRAGEAPISWAWARLCLGGSARKKSCSGRGRAVAGGDWPAEEAVAWRFWKQAGSVAVADVVVWER